MKALIIFGVEHAELKDIPELLKPSRGEAKVQIKALGLCGSDMAAYLGKSPLFVYPNVIGHEFSGKVVELNDPDSPIKTGDRVTASPLFACGKCIACRRGYYNCCTTLKLMGVHVGGAAQTYINIPVSNLVRIPDSMTYQHAAMIEPMTIGYNAAVNRGNVQPKDFVVVLGCGTIGLSAIQACKANGATVLGVDVKDNNLKWARSLGADYIVNSEKEDLVAKVKEYSDGDFATLVIEAVGLQALLRKAIDIMASSGRIVIIGWTKKETLINTSALMLKEGAIIGSRNSRDAFTPVMENISSGKFDVGKMITQEYDFEQGVEALSFWKKNPEKVIKIILIF